MKTFLSMSINLQVQWLSICIPGIFSNLINPVEDLVAYALKLYEATHLTGSSKFPIVSLVKATFGVLTYFEHFQSSDYTLLGPVFTVDHSYQHFFQFSLVSYFKLIFSKKLII